MQSVGLDRPSTHPGPHHVYPGYYCPHHLAHHLAHLLGASTYLVCCRWCAELLQSLLERWGFVWVVDVMVLSLQNLVM